MKIYSVKLCVMKPWIPYCNMKKIVLLENSTFASSIKINKDGETIAAGFTKNVSDLFEIKGTRIMRTKFNCVEDLVTGICFPKLKFVNNVAQVSAVNERIYASIYKKLSHDEVRKFYEALSEEEIELQKQFLLNLIEEQKQYQNPIPENKCARQYVKMIEQKRNSD